MDRIPLAKLAAAGLLGLCLGLSAQAQNLDNRGTDFISTFMPNFDNGVELELQLSSDTETMVTVEYPVNAPTFTTTVAVLPGNVTIVNVPAAAGTAWVADTPANNAIRATADDEFTMYLVNRREFTTDAGLALPVDTFNTEYLVTTYLPLIQSEFTVVAGFDDTTVTITPTVGMIGRPAGVPFTITLDRGEGYLGQSASFGPLFDLSGTSISADRPVGVTNGNVCTNVPTGFGACDHVFEVAQPIQTWGSSIPVAGLPLRADGSIYKIVASEDATSVSLDGGPLTTLDAGDVFETSAIPGNHLFSGDKPIYVTQFMTGQSFGNSTGDPAMGNMIPSAQFQSSYTFATPPGDQFAQNFVTIIADNADVAAGTILLDGTSVPSGNFTPVPGTSLSAAIEPIIGGTHSTSSSTAPHGITVEGYNDFDSYIYPGGALFQFINPPEDNPPVCAASTFAGPPPFATGSVTDNQADDSGVFFVTLSGDAANVALTVDPFTPGDGVATFRLDLVDPGMPGQGTITGTDGAGNTCTASIELAVDNVERCDVDDNGQIDRLDIIAIMARRNQPALGPDDPADANGDGWIDANDARMCTLECDNDRCGTTPPSARPILLPGTGTVQQLGNNGE